MMIERHYDDEALIALMESNGDGSDAHLPSCESCTEKLESVRMIAGALKDEAVWNESSFERPVPDTIAALRAAAMQMEDEDAQAERIVSELLAGPRELWRAKLDARPEYRTAGVVRKLIAAASRAVDTMPPDAVEIAGLAARIADRLDDSSVHAAQLRGAARREHAYALFYTGRFAEALAEADRADEHFARCVVDQYDRARIGIIRALALRALEKWTPGIEAARDAVRIFDEFCDLDRSVSARLAEVHLLFSLRDFDQAIVVLLEQEQLLRASHYIETHARILMNLGYAYWQQGKAAEGANYYDAAIDLFKGLGITTEAVRIQWAFARMLQEAGHSLEALARFRMLEAEFDELGMTSEAALVSLDVAEVILAEEKFLEVEAICQRAMRIFEAAGVAYTAKALTALAYMQEAARNRTATPMMVRHVREYIKRLPVEQNLLFLPL